LIASHISPLVTCACEILSCMACYVVSLATLLMMLTPLQLPYVFYNPSSDGCAHDAEKR